MNLTILGGYRPKVSESGSYIRLDTGCVVMRTSFEALSSCNDLIPGKASNSRRRIRQGHGCLEGTVNQRGPKPEANVSSILLHLQARERLLVS